MRVVSLRMRNNLININKGRIALNKTLRQMNKPMIILKKNTLKILKEIQMAKNSTRILCNLQ